MKIVDLTLTYKRCMRGVAIDTAKTLGEHGWNASTLHLYSHAGTHMDAPSHFIGNRAGIDEIPLSCCIGTAWIIDIPDCRPRQLITTGDLGKVRECFSEGDSLLFRTLWSRRVDQPEYRDGLPRISAELARWCVAKKVKMLGVEPPSVADVNHIEELTEVHTFLSLAIFGADMTLSPSWALCIDIGKKNAGAVSGTMNMAGNLGSFLTALAFPSAEEGIDIICQKPLAPTWEQARKLVEHVQQKQVRFMVHENWRFQPWYREIKKLFEFEKDIIAVWNAGRYNEPNYPNPRYTFGEFLVEGTGGAIRLYGDGRLTI